MTLLDLMLPYQREFILAKQKRKIWLSSRQIGKSHTIAFMLAYEAILKPNSVSLCISVNQASAAEIIKKAKMFAEAICQLSNGQITYTDSFDKIVFSNGSRIISLSSNVDGMRGWTANIVCIDECAFVQHLDEVIQAIAPTLSRNKNAKLILTSTPASKQSYFYQLFEQATNDDNWYVQRTTIFQAKEAGLDVDIEAIKTLCQDKDSFNQEYMCCFADKSASQFLDVDEIQVGEIPATENNISYYIGIDLGRKHDQTAIVVIAKTQQKYYLVDIKTMIDVPYQEQFDKILEVQQLYQAKTIFVDSSGLGGPIAEQLNKVDKRFKPYTFTNNSKNKLFETFKDGCLSKKLFIAEKFIYQLTSEINLVTKNVSESGQIRYNQNRVGNSHADILVAAMLGYLAAYENSASYSLPITYKKISIF